MTVALAARLENNPAQDGLGIRTRSAGAPFCALCSPALAEGPPALGLLIVSSPAVAREALFPIEGQVMVLLGLTRLSTVFIILLCRVDRRTRHSLEVAGTLHNRFGERVLQAVVREHVARAEVPSLARPVTLYASSSREAEDYRAVAAELAHIWRS